MVDIRNQCRHRGPVSVNPARWFRQYSRSRVAGGIADWLHNLAYFGSADFSGFDEECFWNEHANLCREFPRRYLERYRVIFDEHLAGRRMV